MPIILSCKELSQLDLMGIKNISAELCEKALFLLPKLRLLDISFCDGVRRDEVRMVLTFYNIKRHITKVNQNIFECFLYFCQIYL